MKLTRLCLMGISVVAAACPAPRGDCGAEGQACCGGSACSAGLVCSNVCIPFGEVPSGTDGGTETVLPDGGIVIILPDGGTETDLPDGGLEAGGSDLATSLEFSCATYNIGVLADPSDTIEIPCTAIATNSSGQPVADQVQFMAEAGIMKVDPSLQRLEYYPMDPDAGHMSPQVVAVADLDVLVGDGGLSAEPSWSGHHPRNGLVTIIAFVRADPGTVAAQPGMFAYQPFVDANDNNVWDGSPVLPEVPEDFFDEYGDNSYHGPQDTSGDQPAYLWRQVKVLWTGNVQFMPPVASVSPVTADLPYMQTQTFVFSIFDQNLNTVAANDPTTDQVDWNLNPEPDLSLASGQSLTSSLLDPSDPRRLGMLLDSNFEFTAPGNPADWMIGGWVSTTVLDNYQCKTPLASEPFTLYAVVAHTLFLDDSGNPFDQAAEQTVSVGGTLEPPPAATCSSM